MPKKPLGILLSFAVLLLLLTLAPPKAYADDAKKGELVSKELHFEAVPFDSLEQKAAIDRFIKETDGASAFGYDQEGWLTTSFLVPESSENSHDTKRWWLQFLLKITLYKQLLVVLQPQGGNAEVFELRAHKADLPADQFNDLMFIGFNLKPGKQYTLLLRPDQEFESMNKRKFILMDDAAYHDEKQTRRSFLSVYIGILIALLVFNTAVFFGILEGTYLVYNVAILTLFSLTLLSGGYFHDLFDLTPGPVAVVIRMWLVIISPAAIFAFTVFYLEPPWRQKYLIAGVICIFVGLFGWNFWNFYVDHLGNAMYAKGIAALSVPNIVVTLALVIRALLKGSRAAKILLLSIISVIVGIVSQLLVSNGVTESNTFSENAYFITNCVELMILSIGLMDRVGQIRVDRESERQAKEVAEKLARTDPLTGINNRRAFFDFGTLIDSQAQRFEHPYSVLMVDIDHFKSVNDQHGHQVGDAVIQAVAQTISKVIRSSDVVGRIGGEEFAVILPETAKDKACELAERLRNAISKCVIPSTEGAFSVTASLGVAEYIAKDLSIEKTMARADTALYCAKEGGRNKVAY